MARETDDAYKFGVEDLADLLDIEPASVRIKLRNAGVKKASTGRYGWKTKADLQEVADEIGKPVKKGSTSRKAKDEDEKPAKAKAKGKPAPAPAKKPAGKKK